MSRENDYLSEFEREFEVNDFSSEYEDELDSSEEHEDDFSGEYSDEYELSDDHESNDDSEYEFEFETEQDDSEMENYLQEYGSDDREYEDRLYAALSGEHENSFEMEQEVDRVLYEMQKDYFFKGLSNFVKKKSGIFKKLSGIAKQFIPGGTLASLAKLAGGDLRNLLKSDLLKKGLTMAANAALPGVGGAVAGALLNKETPSGVDAARAQAQQAVNVAKDAYQNMAKLLPNLQPGNVSGQINRFSRQALAAARGRHARRFGGGRRAKQVIHIRPGATVVVKRDRIIIY